MGKQVNVAEAKATLSQLLDDAARGEDVVIARAGKPIARLVAVEEPKWRVLGFMEFDVDDSAFDPLTGDELAAWES